MDEKRNTARSFWKGVLAGACMMAVLTVLLVSFGVLSYQIFRQNMQNKSEPQTAEEVVVNARIKDKMEKIAEMLDEEYIEILGNKVLCNTIPIRPGRNVAVICESAAIANRQKKMGQHTAKELAQRLEQNKKG